MANKCMKCGRCCELLKPDCEHYDKEKKICKVHDDKPEECKLYPQSIEKYCLNDKAEGRLIHEVAEVNNS